MSVETTLLMLGALRDHPGAIDATVASETARRALDEIDRLRALLADTVNDVGYTIDQFGGDLPERLAAALPQKLPE